MSDSNDRAGKSYWDANWGQSDIPSAVDPHAPGLQHWVSSRFHGEFVRAFAQASIRPGARLLEIGAARSAWLPYFAREHGLSVTGLDYSDIGCAQALEVMRRAGVSGDMIKADLFDPPANALGRFDVVVSFGVAEHFKDTVGAIRAFSRFVAPGGVMLTLIPNMVGAIGALQKRLSRSVYDIHVPIDRETLASAHREAGLDVVACDYLLFSNFGVLNLNGVPERTPAWLVKKGVLALAGRLSMASWRLDPAGRLPPNRLTSPYVLCVARSAAQRETDH
jgi:SAM-dependent methyltransferase